MGTSNLELGTMSRRTPIRISRSDSRLTVLTRYKVTLVPCGPHDRRRSVAVLARSEWDARCRAVAQIYGPRAFWLADHAKGVNYGQVFALLRPTPVNSDPGRHKLSNQMRMDIVLIPTGPIPRRLRRRMAR